MLDVINYSFSRTDTRELYSKIIFNYHYDFSTKTYIKNKTISADILTGYDFDFYNTSELEKTIDCRFVYDDNSAQYVAEYLLLQNCNPHNIIKVTLPLKYIEYE